MTAQPATRVTDLRMASDYWRLTKPDINLMIGITTGVGFFLADKRHPALLAEAVFATMFVAAGASTLNQYFEREYDASMRRTLRRPIAAGRISAPVALRFGMALSLTGAVWLALATGPLASALAIATLISYLFLYTPLKRRTPLCVLVGAVPGAMPPLIGWAAATGGLGLKAWVLAAAVFLWQFPHVMAIAWMYQYDYHRAGYLVLPGNETTSHWVFWQTLPPLIALIALALLSGFGMLYATGAVLLGTGFLFCGVRFLQRTGAADARKLLFASIVYLPCLFLLAVLTS